MPAHGLVSGVSVEDLTAAIVKACKSSGLILSVQLGALDDGVELRVNHATTPHLQALMLNLAAAGIGMDLAECEVTQAETGRVVHGRGMQVVDGEVQEQDLSPRAEDLFVAVSGGSTVHEVELIAGHVAAVLLGRDPDEFRAVRMLSFKRKDGR